MIKHKPFLVLLLIGMILLSGCTTATIKSYLSPTIIPGSFSTIAIFPIRNARMLPGETREVNQSQSNIFHGKNPDVKLMEPAQASDLLSKTGLANKYNNFLENYDETGVTNPAVLKEIGDSLKVDAILQGEVFDLNQIDGLFGAYRGRTSLTLSYSLFSTKSGAVLWEVASRVIKFNPSSIGEAPRLYDVIILAQNRILAQLPKLGEQGGKK
jgi:hypothetical protein